MSTKIDTITEMADRLQKHSSVADTPQNRLVLLTEIRSDWINEESVSPEKDAWIETLTKMIADLKAENDL